ncbi:MAG: J domain-containing protein [Alphaproteobacteria bacterium]|nr:J domain-containing protein [Alphaproteobacteria bacterium]
MRRRRNGTPHPALDGPRPCEHPGCLAEGVHPAPRSRNQLRDFYWFCVDHVQEYNRGWDFFAGMSPEEILAFRTADVVGHRPTWRMGVRGSWRGEAPAYDANDPFDGMQRAFTRGGETAPRPRVLTREERDALSLMDLDAPVDRQELKRRYRVLVKRHHPDANGGDKGAEARLRAIIQAYDCLLALADK